MEANETGELIHGLLESDESGTVTDGRTIYKECLDDEVVEFHFLQNGIEYDSVVVLSKSIERLTDEELARFLEIAGQPAEA